VTDMVSVQLSLLRHGETTEGKAYIGRSDPMLTALGRQQMEAAVEGESAWDGIVSSPRRRCLSFAQPLSEQTDSSLIVMDEFAEYDFGVMEGLTAVQVLEQYPGVLEAFWEDPRRCSPPDAEPLPAFEQRLRRGLQSLLNRYAGQHLLVVCHGGVIRALRCLEQRQPIDQLLQYSAPHGALYSLNLRADLL